MPLTNDQVDRNQQTRINNSLLREHGSENKVVYMQYPLLSQEIKKKGS